MCARNGCCPSPGPSSPWLSLPSPTPDDSTAAPKTPWGINIIRKNRKAAPRAFGVRLEECQPATENQVGPLCIPKQGGKGGAQGTRVRAARDFGANSLVPWAQLGHSPGCCRAEAEPRIPAPSWCSFTEHCEAMVFLAPRQEAVRAFYPCCGAPGSISGLALSPAWPPHLLWPTGGQGCLYPS